jgi:hypothetical protein
MPDVVVPDTDAPTEADTTPLASHPAVAAGRGRAPLAR